MKRVLNSGSIKLPYVEGSEEILFDQFKWIWPNLSTEDFIAALYKSTPHVLENVRFKFEIKAPLLVFNTFQEAHLGTLNRLEVEDHQIAYLPPSFYKQDGLMVSIMDVKSCNVYNTKLYNFYNAAFNFYNNLIKEGMCEEQAKLVLPQGLFTSFLWDVNAKNLVTFIEKNHNKSPELFGYCSTLVLYLEDHLPQFTKWLKVHKWRNINL